MRSSIVFQPLGVILGVQPWNWPYHQVFRMAVPALPDGPGWFYPCTSAACRATDSMNSNTFT